MKTTDRPEELSGQTIRIRTDCGSLYITCNKYEGKLQEVFVTLGKGGGCGKSMTEAIGRIISKWLQKNGDPSDIIKALKGIKCPSGDSCASLVAEAMEKLNDVQPKNESA